MRIGRCELDLEQRQIRRDGELLALSPRCWDVLEELIGNRGRLVTTRDLLAHHWHGGSPDEAYVRKAISEIRRVLGDSAQTPSYVRTVPKLGYVLTSADEAVAEEPAAEASRRIIAVLPFANFSDDSKLDYFCDGLTEEVLNKLSHDAEAPVVARTSAFQFKDRDLDIREIGRMLGANLLLEGSVRSDSGMIRVTAQFIDAVTGLHQWSEHYDHPRINDIETQDRIAAAIALRVRSTSDTGESPPPTVIVSERFTSPEDFQRLRDAIEAARKTTRR